MKKPTKPKAPGRGAPETRKGKPLRQPRAPARGSAALQGEGGELKFLDLVHKVAKHSGLSEAKVRAVLGTMARAMREAAETGLPVHREGFGTFTPDPAGKHEDGEPAVIFTPDPPPGRRYS